MNPLLSVIDRNSIETQLPPSFPYAVISIATPGKNIAQFETSSHCTGVLYMEFHDLDDPRHKVPLFNREQAEAVWKFVDALHVSTELLIVHCEAGISRSPAVAAAIAKARGENDDYFFRRYLPNRHVYRTLLDVRNETKP